MLSVTNECKSRVNCFLVYLVCLTLLFIVGFSSGFVYAQIDNTPTESMLAYYPLNGNANDLSKYGNNGTIFGATACTSSALCFDGIDDYINVGNLPLFDSITDGLTISAWIKPNTEDGPKVITAKWDDNNSTHSFIFKIHNDGSGKLRIELSKRRHHDLIDLGGTTFIPINTWTHVTVVYGNNIVKLYVNGVEDASGITTGGTIKSSSANLLIGAVETGGGINEFFDGSISKLRIYNTPLDPSIIQSFYAEGPTNIVQVAPAVGVVSKSGIENTNITFTVSDFTNQFSAGTGLAKIKVLSLPNNGLLKLSGNNVTLNQEISIENLDNLVYVPLSNWVGNDNFTWNGSDGTTYAANSAIVNINIIVSFPVVGSVTKNGYMYTPIEFSSMDFKNSFTNTTFCNGLNKIQITNLPSNGMLRLFGKNTYVNQEIPTDSLNNLTFVPLAQWYGSDHFLWNGFDGTRYARNASNVTLNIADSCPPNN